MLERFLILDHDSPRPKAERIVFCDGAGGELFREKTDLDLSHWRPNRTPKRYRADTSTAICLRFLEDPVPADWTLAVNNHLDVDGILSVFTLVHSSFAKIHRSDIVQAAEMGDFWGWGEPPAQRLFQGLTLLMNRRRSEGASIQAIYNEAFDRIPAFLEGSDHDSPAIERSLEPLRHGIRLVEQGSIDRRQYSDRFAHYVIPTAVVGEEIAQGIYIPKFNEAISAKALLWPQARAMWDEQRVTLVSVETTQGWHHDLWFPGYLWADVENRWTLPGLHYRDGMESYELELPALDDAIRGFNENEKGAGRWMLGTPAFMFHSKLQSEFPVVMRVLDGEGNPTASTLRPGAIAVPLAAVFH